MRCKDLFKNSDIVYLPVTGKAVDQEKDIMTYCWYHGYKVKFKLGVFVDVKGQTIDRVLRVEKISEGERAGVSKKHTPVDKEREAKIKKVSKMLKKGKSVADISKKYNVSVQSMYYFIRKWVTVGENEL